MRQYVCYGFCLSAFLVLVWWANPSQPLVSDGSDNRIHGVTVPIAPEVTLGSNWWRVGDWANGYIRTASPTRTPVEDTGGGVVWGGEVNTAALQSPYQEERLALYEMVCETFADDPWMCGHVVWAESIGDWAAQPEDPLYWHRVVYGPYVSPTCDRGLMQINCVHARRFTEHGWDYYVDAYDPVKNLVIAREIYNDQGCAGWSTC